MAKLLAILAFAGITAAYDFNGEGRGLVARGYGGNGLEIGVTGDLGVNNQIRIVRGIEGFGYGGRNPITGFGGVSFANPINSVGISDGGVVPVGFGVGGYGSAIGGVGGYDGAGVNNQIGSRGGNGGYRGFDGSNQINSVGEIPPVGSLGVGGLNQISSFGGVTPIGYGGVGVPNQINSIDGVTPFRYNGIEVGNLGGINGVGVTNQFASREGNAGYRDFDGSNQINSVRGIPPAGSLGVGGLNQISTVGGVTPIGFGVPNLISSIEGATPFTYNGVGVGNLGGINGVGVPNQIGSVGPYFGGLTGVRSPGTIQSYGGPRGLTPLNRADSVSTGPRGYYGGVLAYPAIVGTPDTTNQLSFIPINTITPYKGYFDGYYPGSVGYGQNYRFLQ